MKRLIYGVGINDSSDPVNNCGGVFGARWTVKWCPFYRTWNNMLKRCYSKGFQERFPTYSGCSVYSEWLTFSCFKDWMNCQEWEGLQLDKDVLTPGNKVYGPDHCAFISQPLNKFLSNNGATRGNWPIGVSLNNRNAKFQADCRNPFTGQKQHLGYFETPQEAHEAWRKRKHELACQYADMQTDNRVAEALRSRFSKPLNGRSE